MLFLLNLPIKSTLAKLFSPIISFIPSLGRWIQQHKITLINTLVTLILITAAIFVLLNRATAIQRETAHENMRNVAAHTASEVQSFYSNYYNLARTVSETIQGFENIDADRRRRYIDSIILEIFNSNQILLDIYTLWQPDGLDGMDELFINTPGSDETGQFISGFTRMLGFVERKTFEQYKPLLDDEVFALSYGRISEPIPTAFVFGETWVVDIQIPILRGNDLVGLIGLSINLERLQFLIEALRPYNTGRAMVSSRTGLIVAHYQSQMRGSNLTEAIRQDTHFENSNYDEIYQAILQSIDTQNPVLLETENSLMVSYPLRPSSLASVAYFGAASDVSWTVITTVPLSTIFEPINNLITFSIYFIIGTGILIAFVLFFTSSSVIQQAETLERELGQTTAMQDNLKYGLFMLDHKYEIMETYSKALEKILSISSLQGMDFTELLTSSLRSKEKENLRDYFEMVINGSFDMEMLEDINPINNITYVSNETGAVKNLRSTFTQLKRGGRGRTYILGTLEDITKEKELEKQLMDAENQREQEMQALFQVIQLNPQILNDFIVDVEHEFNTLNDILRGREDLHSSVLVDIYQIIHAIKSNALILNLESFSNKLHNYENTIKKLQDDYEDLVPLDSFLDLVFRLNEVMKEKDQLKNTMSKISNFKAYSAKEDNQERFVFQETLIQACNKAQIQLQKKVKLVIDKIDDDVIHYGPRRDIKEIIVQMIRNAIAHGIETPEERKNLSKESEGVIRLSILHNDNDIKITFTDDGRGIDFEKIREKAERKNLLQNPADAKNKSILIKTLFSPGFSTAENADHYSGRGIGLSLVRDRLKNLNGNIKISTLEGKGTTFNIRIPMEIPLTVNKAS